MEASLDTLLLPLEAFNIAVPGYLRQGDYVDYLVANYPLQIESNIENASQFNGNTSSTYHYFKGARATLKLT
jgi:hypothetical protein